MYGLKDISIILIGLGRIALTYTLPLIVSPLLYSLASSFYIISGLLSLPHALSFWIDLSPKQERFYYFNLAGISLLFLSQLITQAYSYSPNDGMISFLTAWHVIDPEMNPFVQFLSAYLPSLSMLLITAYTIYHAITISKKVIRSPIQYLYNFFALTFLCASTMLGIVNSLVLINLLRHGSMQIALYNPYTLTQMALRLQQLYNPLASLVLLIPSPKTLSPTEKRTHSPKQTLQAL